MLRHMLMGTGAAASLAVALSLTGCSSGMACTAVGASDTVRVDLRAVPFAGVARPITAEVCLDATCAAPKAIVGSQIFFSGSGDFLTQERTRVQVNVYSENRLIRRAAGTVQPEEFAPNGRQCGPVVSAVRVEFEANDTLRQVPVNEE